MLPRLSLVTPSFNQAQFLQATLESVRAQNYPALEWIVMDGGSADDSVEILRGYEKHFAYWTSARDRGQADALRQGFARATGEIFGWLNSDDLLLPGALHAVGAYFAAHPDCHFVTGDGVFVNADATRELFDVRAAPYTFAELLHYAADKYLPQPSVFFSRAAYLRVGGLDASLQYAMDVDLWLRLRREFELQHVAQRWSLMRLHDGAKSRRARARMWGEVEWVVRRHWQRVSRAERAQLWYEWRTLRARASWRAGLEEAQRADSRGAWAESVRALQQDPATIFSRDARRVWARLLLPRALRKRWLRVP